MKAVFKSVSPYQKDAMNLPVRDRESAIPFYEKVMGFRLVSRTDVPCRSAVLSRDGIQIGLAENGGDPTQDGCYFEVDDVEAAFAELKRTAWKKRTPASALIVTGTAATKCSSSSRQTGFAIALAHARSRKSRVRSAGAFAGRLDEAVCGRHRVRSESACRP